MLRYCIRSEPRLMDDEYTSSTKLEKPTSSKVRVETPAFMIDLESGLNHTKFAVYEPRDIPQTAWVHGSRLAI